MTSLLNATGLAAGAVAAGLVLAGSPGPAETAPAGAATPGTELAADDLRLVARTTGRGEDRRRIVRYVVRPGDTATGLAVRFHAWTAELLAMNGLSYSSPLQVGRRLRIPVVPEALRDHDHRRARPAPKADRPRPKAETPRPRSQARPERDRPDRDRPVSKPKQRKAVEEREKKWRWADPSHATVRRAIVRTARAYGVDPHLALAVSWQEAGWQMHHISSADAIGAMQVLPTTGTWMSLYVGRPLRLHTLRDNVAAGVMLLKVLDDNTGSRRRMIGAYYQGLGAVSRHGLYQSTRKYVANVRAIERRLEAGRPPS